MCVPVYNQLFIEATVYNLLIYSFPTSGHDPNQGGGDSDIGLQEGFLENSLIMSNQHMCELFI